MVGPPRDRGVVVGHCRVPARALVEEPGFWLYPFWMYQGEWRLISWVSVEDSGPYRGELIASWVEPDGVFSGWRLYDPERMLLVAPA